MQVEICGKNGMGLADGLSPSSLGLGMHRHQAADNGMQKLPRCDFGTRRGSDPSVQTSEDREARLKEPGPTSALCLNCDTALGEANFCPSCGQKNSPHRVSLWHLVASSFEDAFELDSRLFKSLFFLLFRPGFLTHAYNEGRRKAYFPPFRFYLVTSILYFFVVGFQLPFSQIEQGMAEPDTSILNSELLAEFLPDGVVEDMAGAHADNAGVMALIFEELKANDGRLSAESQRLLAHLAHRSARLAKETEAKLAQLGLDLGTQEEGPDEKDPGALVGGDSGRGEGGPGGDGTPSVRTSPGLAGARGGGPAGVPLPLSPDERSDEGSTPQLTDAPSAGAPEDDHASPEVSVAQLQAQIARLKQDPQFCVVLDHLDLQVNANSTRSERILTTMLAKLSRMTPRELKDAFKDGFLDLFPKLLFLLLPLFALYMKLLYLKRSHFYVEHLVFALHFHTLIFIVLLLSKVLPGAALPVLVLLGLVYLTLSLRRVYEQSWGVTLIKLLVLMVVYGSTLLVAGVGASAGTLVMMLG